MSRRGSAGRSTRYVGLGFAFPHVDRDIQLSNCMESEQLEICTIVGGEGLTEQKGSLELT